MQQVNCDYLIDYFNGELDDVTLKKYEAHLEECDSCQNELAELHSLTEDLPYASEAVTPPDGMKDRILESVFLTEAENETDTNEEQKEYEAAPVKPQKKWITPLLAASLLFSLIGNGILLLNNDSPSQGNPIASEGTDRLLKTVHLSASERVDSEAVASMIEKDKGLKLIVQANDLPSLKGTEAYQVWLLEDGKPYRAGTFVSNQNGIGAVSYTVDYSGEHQWDTVAITLEPTPNSEQPKGDILLSSGL